MIGETAPRKRGRAREIGKRSYPAAEENNDGASAPIRQAGKKSWSDKPANRQQSVKIETVGWRENIYAHKLSEEIHMETQQSISCYSLSQSNPVYQLGVDCEGSGLAWGPAELANFSESFAQAATISRRELEIFELPQAVVDKLEFCDEQPDRVATNQVLDLLVEYLNLHETAGEIAEGRQRSKGLHALILDAFEERSEDADIDGLVSDFVVRRCRAWLAYPFQPDLSA